MSNTDESNEGGETLAASPPPTTGAFLTLQKAIDLGQFDPEYLSRFPEWHELPRTAQFELVKKAIENRDAQIWRHYAELNNVLDLRLKPQMKPAMDKLVEEHKKLMDEKEKLFVKYAMPEE